MFKEKEKQLINKYLHSYRVTSGTTKASTIKLTQRSSANVQTPRSNIHLDSKSATTLRKTEKLYCQTRKKNLAFLRKGSPLLSETQLKNAGRVQPSVTQRTQNTERINQRVTRILTARAAISGENTSKKKEAPKRINSALALHCERYFSGFKKFNRDEVDPITANTKEIVRRNSIRIESNERIKRQATNTNSGYSRPTKAHFSNFLNPQDRHRRISSSSSSFHLGDESSVTSEKDIQIQFDIPEIESHEAIARRIEQDPIALIDEKLLKLEKIQNQLGFKFGAKMSEFDQIVEEKMMEQKQIKKFGKLMFTGPYKHCQPMKAFENIVHEEILPPIKDPIWEEELIRRPNSPRVIHHSKTLEEEIKKLIVHKKARANLSATELLYLEQEFKRKDERKGFNIELVDELLRGMFFFIKFNAKVRERIIHQSELRKYPKGHVLFKQGDFGDKMYVILKGSVNVIVNIPNKFTGQARRRVVAWMNDGASFGEYSMLGGKTRGKKQTVYMKITELSNNMRKREDYLKTGIFYGQKIDLDKHNLILDEIKNRENQIQYIERTKRAADIEVIEEAYLLEIEREFFREIILLTIKDEYEKKMRLIAELPFFKSQDMLKLMPVVNFFKKRIFRLGQPILLQGDLMSEFGVIAKGRCKVVNIVMHKRSNIKSFKVKGLRKKKRNLHFGNEQFKIKQESRKDIGYIKLQKDEAQKRVLERRRLDKIRFEKRKLGEIDENDELREFSYMEDDELIEKHPDNNYYKGHTFVKFLERGSIYGLKTLQKYALIKTDEGFVLDKDFMKHASLSIIAETSKVVVYTFNISNFKYLTEDIKKTLLNEISKSVDFDEEDLERIKYIGSLWDEYKDKLFLDKINEQYDQRRIDDYKKLGTK